MQNRSLGENKLQSLKGQDKQKLLDWDLSSGMEKPSVGDCE